MKTNRLSVLLFLVALVLTSAAWAHNPIVINGGPTDSATAPKVEDISISRVAYHHVKDGQTALWLTFDGKAGQKLEYQMGVPKIDRYSAVRPATVVIGPGLPAAPALPFEIPAGMGAVLVTTEGREPSVVNEEFTGTASWQFNQESLDLPADGKYYMVTFLPSGGEGKVWVALGEAEVFGLWDLIRMPAIIIEVRAFHEIFFWGGILGWAYLIIAAFFSALAGLVGGLVFF